MSLPRGRIAYANVRKVIFLLISTGAAELVLFTPAAVRNGCGAADPHRRHVHPLDQRRPAYPADNAATLAGTAGPCADRAGRHGTAQGSAAVDGTP